MKPFSEGLEKLVGEPWSIWELVVSWAVVLCTWICLGTQPELYHEVLEGHSGTCSQAYKVNNMRGKMWLILLPAFCLIKWHSQRCIVVITFYLSCYPFLLLIRSWNLPIIQSLPWLAISQSTTLFILLTCWDFILVWSTESLAPECRGFPLRWWAQIFTLKYKLINFT